MENFSDRSEKAEYKKLHVKSVQTVSEFNNSLQIYNGNGELISSNSIYPEKKSIIPDAIYTYSRKNDTLIQEIFYQNVLVYIEKKLLNKKHEGYLANIENIDKLTNVQISRFSDSAGWVSQEIVWNKYGYPAKIQKDFAIREENLPGWDSIDSIKIVYDFKKKTIYQYVTRFNFSAFTPFEKYSVTKQFDARGKLIHILWKTSKEDLNALANINEGLNSLTNIYGQELNKNDEKRNVYNLELERSEDYTYLKGKIVQTIVIKQSNISGRIRIKTERFETLLYSNGLPQIKYLIAENNERKVLQSWTYKYF